MRRRKFNSAALTMAALALCWALSACGPTTWQDAVIRTADVLTLATEKTVPDLMAAASRKQADTCIAKHPKGSKELKACIAPILKRLRVWQDKVRPALRVTIKALVALYDEFKPGAKVKPLKPPVTPARPVPARP